MTTYTRRQFLAATGGLTVAFSLSRPAVAQDSEVGSGGDTNLPGSLTNAPTLDAWIRIDPNGDITVATGKAELGQGIATALLMLAAEELVVDPAEITMVTADTAQTPDEGYTAASHSMEYSGTAIRYAAANVRELLVEEAARQLDTEAASLTAGNGQVRGATGAVSYGDLAAALDLAIPARSDVSLLPRSAYRVIGSEVPRIDIPAKVTGAPIFVQDFRPEGMVHAQVVRPPGPGATLVSADLDAIDAMPGVIGTHRDGSFLAVVAQGEWQAMEAAEALRQAAVWDTPATLPPQDGISDWLRANEADVGTVAQSGRPDVPDGPRTLRATFERPYTMHGSIGPSAAVAEMRDGKLTVWSHTQGVYPDRTAIAEMLGMDADDVRVAHMQGAGCYGHNGADDAAADAALIAVAFPGRPIRLSWSRAQEHVWEPFGSAMTMDIAGTVDDGGRITHFNYDLWSCAHVSRPGGADKLLAANHLANPVPFVLPDMLIIPPGLGDRNADPLYTIPNKRVLYHFVKPMPLRTSALRALGAHGNVFAIECFMDDLAAIAGLDPVEFRLANMDDPRARDVIERAATEFGWSSDPLPANRGRGFAFARYKNMAAYLAMALDLDVDPETGRIKVRNVTAAIDSGHAVSPDGIRNQTEGGIVQSLSWTLFEAVTFDDTRITSTDWTSYPMARFGDVPDSVAVHVMDRPGKPFLGTGEAAQGPTAAAIGNALRQATGIRMRSLPLSPDRVKAALERGS